MKMVKYNIRNNMKINKRNNMKINKPQFRNLIRECIKEVMMEADVKSIAQQLKGKHVTNPETKKKILATTALSYGEKHPAYKAAVALVKKTKVPAAKPKASVSKDTPKYKEWPEDEKIMGKIESFQNFYDNKIEDAINKMPEDLQSKWEDATAHRTGEDTPQDYKDEFEFYVQNEKHFSPDIVDYAKKTLKQIENGISN